MLRNNNLKAVGPEIAIPSLGVKRSFTFPEILM